MNRDKLRLLTLFGLSFYLLSLMAPAMVAWVDIEVPEALEEMIVPEQKEGYDQLNEVQRKAMVDWERSTSPQGYSFIQSSSISQNIFPYRLTLDLSGNAYVTGSFSGTAVFGNIILTSSGSRDIFIAKLSSSGSWLWAVKAGGSSNDLGEGMAVDSSGNAYVTGQFRSLTAHFGSTSLTSSGNTDIFIAKLSSNGSWLWAVKAGGSSWDYGKGISVDSSGNAYVIGQFQDTATFGSTSLTSSGSYDIFVAKLSSSGSWQWVVKTGGTNTESGYGIDVDSSGNSYATGFFKGTATFGSTSLTSSGDYDIFVAKLSSSGSWQWAVKAGGSSDDRGRGIAVDSSGNSYVIGDFTGTVTFGSTSLTSSGSEDIFIAKLNISGIWQWVVNANGSSSTSNGIAVDLSGNVHVTWKFGTEIYVGKLNSSGTWQSSVNFGGSSISPKDIAVDSIGNVYVTGNFQETAIFGSTILSTAGDDMWLLSLYNISLQPTLGFETAISLNTCSVCSIGIIGYDTYSDLAVDSGGNVYVTGNFRNSLTIGGFTLVSSGEDDIFVAKLSSSGSWQWAVKAGGSEEDRGEGIAVDSSGNVYVTGSFRNSSGNQPAIFGSFDLESNGYSDVFVAKLSSSGSWSWVVSAGGSSYDSGVGVDVAQQGQFSEYVYVMGEFKNTAKFGSFNITSSGNYDVFVGRLNSEGSWLWVKQAGGVSEDRGKDITVCTCSGYGPILITGFFQGTASFGPYSSNQLTSNGMRDIFVASLSISGSGSWNWARQAGGSNYDTGGGITFDSNHNVIVTGNYYDSADFGTISLTSTGGYDVFVAKLAINGSWEWAVGAGGADGHGSGIAVDSSGNAYVTGYFQGTATFGSTSLPSSGNFDIFIAKLNSSGSWLWAVKAGGSSSDIGEGIAIDSNGNAYVIGTFEGTAAFGTTNLVTNDTGMFIAVTGLDLDGDMFFGEDDKFPLQMSQHLDSDGDGFGNNLTGYHGDSCPTISGTSWQDRWGCPDMDGDGQSDLFDSYMQNPTQWNDTDGDGLGDNWDGVTVDRNDSTNGIGEYWVNAHLPDPSPLDYDNDGFEDSNLQYAGATGPYDDCPFIYGTSTEDYIGCIDSDGDGWSDSGDSHPGDGTQHSDQDNDGYGDNATGNQPDACPTVYGDSWKDFYGCVDSDGDGVSNLTDFDDTNASEWSDSDDDGYGDNSDECLYIWGNITSGSDKGCLDSDGDGWADRSDDFPFDSEHHEDGDGDGYGENSNGSEPDACPNEAGTSWLGGFGCPDADRDGWGDVNDAFTTDSSQWNDSDGDGYGDNAEGREPDTCPDSAGDSSEGDVFGCPDSDGDGWANIEDRFPESNTTWSDADGDGYADQGADDCPNLFGISSISMVGCPDLDDDGLPDILDPDIDGDGLFNTWEYQTDNDPFDANDYPDDTDGDGIPDKYDDDDDGDGFPDSVEKERGTDPKDPEDNPMNQYGDNSGIFFIPGEGFQSGYDAEGYELSVSALVNLLTSEFLLPLLLLPASLLLLLRKRGRFKKMRKRLKSVDSVDELGGAEEAIDRLIMKNRVKVVHGILLRNLYERRRDQLGEDGPKPTLQSRNEQMPPERPTEWNSPPQRPDDLGNDQYMGGGRRY